MFNFLTDAIENALNVADATLSGDDISKRQVAKLLADGLTIAATASATGIAIDVIEKWLEE